jgi:hypothetical protein
MLLNPSIVRELPSTTSTIIPTSTIASSLEATNPDIAIAEAIDLYVPEVASDSESFCSTLVSILKVNVTSGCGHCNAR